MSAINAPTDGMDFGGPDDKLEHEFDSIGGFSAACWSWLVVHCLFCWSEHWDDTGTQGDTVEWGVIRILVGY